VKEGTLGRGPLVGTFPQELSSLQLTGEPVMVQKEETLRCPTEAPKETGKKQLLPNVLTKDRELEAPTAANCALGLMSIPGQQLHKKTAVTWWDTSGC